MKQKAGEFLRTEVSWAGISGRLVNVMGLSVFADWYLQEVRLLPSHREQELGALVFFAVSLQRVSFQLLEKDIPGL